MIAIPVIGGKLDGDTIKLPIDSISEAPPIIVRFQQVKAEFCKCGKCLEFRGVIYDLKVPDGGTFTYVMRVNEE